MARLNFGGLALAGMTAIAISGCGDIYVPPKGQPSRTTVAAACDRDRSGPGTVFVCPGDTLIGLARIRNVTVSNLMKANGLADDRIQAGSILTVPDEYVHVVQPGETILGISRQNNVTAEAVIAANELTNPDRLLPETRLAIPRRHTSVAMQQPVRQSPIQTVPTTPASAPQPVGTTPATSAPSATSSVTIGPRRPSAPSSEQPESQPFTPPAPRMVDSTPRAEGTATEQASRIQPQPRQRPAHTNAPTATARETTASPKAQSKPARPAAAPRFVLPVEGKILSDFGPKSGGLHNDGINIAAPRGTPIRATAEGIVAYAGDGLPGFGNLLLIKHADGWTSAYAHADSIAVGRGDMVKQGQLIATIGATGSVTEPQLHFELRQHDRAVDPKKMVE